MAQVDAKLGSVSATLVSRFRLICHDSETFKKEIYIFNHVIATRSGKVQVGKDQEKAQSEKDSHSKNPVGKKQTNSRMSSYFPNRWPLSYLNLTKTMKTHIRRQQHKKIKHQDIKQKEPPQKYRLGTISYTKLLAGLNRFYRRLASPSASAVVHNI